MIGIHLLGGGSQLRLRGGDVHLPSGERRLQRRLRALAGDEGGAERRSVLRRSPSRVEDMSAPTEGHRRVPAGELDIGGSVTGQEGAEPAGQVPVDVKG